MLGPHASWKELTISLAQGKEDVAELSEMIGALTVAADLTVWRAEGRFDPAFTEMAELIEAEYMAATAEMKNPEQSLVGQLLLILGRLADSEHGKSPLKKPS